MAIEKLDAGSATPAISATQAKINALLVAARAAKTSGNTALARQKLTAANKLLTTAINQTATTAAAEQAVIDRKIESTAAATAAGNAEANQKTQDNAAKASEAVQALAAKTDGDTSSTTVNVADTEAMPGFINIAEDDPAVIAANNAAQQGANAAAGGADTDAAAEGKDTDVPPRPAGTPKAYVYDPVLKIWVRPAKPSGKGPLVWDDDQGWIAPVRPIGTSIKFVYDEATNSWIMPPKPTTEGNWVWDNNEGWVDSKVTPGSTGFGPGGTVTLAKETFKNTLALFFGAKEMSQPWVDALYKTVSGFYNSGSTIDESFNLALQDVRNNPELKPFTDRFNGIYELQDRLARGEAVTVPTIAEYFKTEAAMGDVLRNAGLGDLATQSFLGGVLGRGKSLLEVSNLIDKTFNSIDNAPEALKKDLQDYFPGVDRTSIAKALLTGKEGWAELDKKYRSVSVLSAAKTQGVNIDLTTGAELANLGVDYTGALGGFQTVKQLERGKMLGETSGIKFGQEQAISATFKQDAKALADIERIKAAEVAKYQGSAGRLASRSRAAGLF